MRYVAAYLLAVLGGNNSPKVADIKKILASVGIDCDDSKAKTVVDALTGKSIEELIEKGKSKLASVPSAGAVAAVPAAGTAAPAGGKADKKEEKKEAKKEEKKEEEEDEDMGFGLFD